MLLPRGSLTLPTKAEPVALWNKRADRSILCTLHTSLPLVFFMLGQVREVKEVGKLSRV